MTKTYLYACPSQVLCFFMFASMKQTWLAAHGISAASRQTHTAFHHVAPKHSVANLFDVISSKMKLGGSGFNLLIMNVMMRLAKRIVVTIVEWHLVAIP